MNIAVVSYSLTGNNGKLAQHIADALAARHIVVLETKPRNDGTTAADLLLNRTPQVELEDLERYDLVLFFAPVWVGHVASTLRAYLKQMKKNRCRYAFFSVCGGVDGPNTKLEGELKRRTGREPEAAVDLRIADLLPKTPKPTWPAATAYRLAEDDVIKFAGAVMETVKSLTGKEETA